jgi:hypothetical protein
MLLASLMFMPALLPLQSLAQSNDVSSDSEVSQSNEIDAPARPVDLRDLAFQRRRGAILCSGMTIEKRRLSEDSKRDNDHNELSVLANSFPSPVRLSN